MSAVLQSLVELGFAKLVGRAIRWHEWRAVRTRRSLERHLAALLVLADVSASGERRAQRRIDQLEGRG